MLSQTLMSFTSTWLNKCAFLSLQEYEIKAENKFNVYDAMCFARLLATTKFKAVRRKCRKASYRNAARSFLLHQLEGN